MRERNILLYFVSSLLIVAGLLVLSEQAIILEQDEAPELFLLSRRWSGEYYFDGILHLLKFHMIQHLPDEISRVSPFHLEVRFRTKKSPDRFKFYFASSATGQFYFYYNDSNMSESGVFFEKDFSTSKLFDFSTIHPGNEIRFEVFSRENELTVEFNDIPFTTGLAEKIDHITLNILNWPFYAQSLLIDHVEISRIVIEDGSDVLYPVKLWDFESPPVIIDLPLLLGLMRYSIWTIVFSFLFLVLAAALADMTENRLFRHFYKERRVPPNLQFSLVPIRFMMLFVLRSIFALPVLSLILSSLLVAVVKTIPLFRSVEDSRAKRPANRFVHIHLVAGAIIYSALAIPVLNRLTTVYDLPGILAVGTLFSPLCLLLIIYSLSLHTPAPTFNLALLQCALFPVFRLFCPYPDFPLFLLLTMLPWIIWNVRYITVSRSGGRLNPAVSALIIPLVLAGAVELSMRGNGFAGLKLDYRQRIANLHWDFEERTDLFGGPKKEETLVIRDYEYSVRKPEGNKRIVCLGSSSTWGVGCIEPNNQYPVQLERRLRGETGDNVEVINAGIIPGAPFTMLLIYLEGVLVNLDPDLVVVYFGDNHDISGLLEYYESLKCIVKDNPYINTNEKMWAAMQLRIRNPILVDGFRALSRFRSFVAVNLLTQGIKSSIAGSAETDPFAARRTDIASTVERLVRVCLDNGIKVMLIPEVTLVDVSAENRSHAYYNIFEDQYLENSGKGVYYLDLLDYFKDVIKNLPPHEEKTAVLVDEMHLSDYGYSLLAGKIADSIINNRIIELSR